MTDRANVLSCQIDRLTMDETVTKCVDLIERNAGAQHVVVNAAKLVAMRSDEELARIIRSCAIVNADGQSVVWAARLLGDPLPERVAGIDLMYRIFEVSSERGYPVYILGAEERVLIRAIVTLRSAYPRLEIAGSHHGWFDDTLSESIVQEIQSSGARVLFVAMSSPRKEKWLSDHLADTGASLAIGVGGAIDVVAGMTSRAPIWMQRAGLEWLFRLLQEPRRLGARYARTNSRFIILVVREMAIKRRRLKRA